MSKKEHRDHALYSILAPRMLQIFTEELTLESRPSFSKCRMTPDGKFLDLYVSNGQNTQELAKTLAPYAHELQSIIANAQVLSRMPRVRFRIDAGAASGESVADILDDIRAKYDLS